MTVFLRIAVNLVTGSLLGTVFGIATLRLDHEDALNRLFLNASLIVLSMLLLESLTCAIDGMPAFWIRCISKAAHALLFSLPPVLTYCWFLFTRLIISGEDTRRVQIRPLTLIPVVINGLAAVLSPFFNWTFVIDGGGFYHRGPFFPAFMGITYSYLLIGPFLLLKRREKLLRGDFAIILLFCILPILGGLIQGLIYGPLLMWGCTACALVILYVYLQEKMIQTDSLTGAWSRASFEHSLRRMMHEDSGEPFGIIYVDIDDFKSINDELGHDEGDVALKALVGAIKPLLRKSDSIARLGGDEFAIVVRVDGPEGLRAVVKKIETALEHYNRSSQKPYALECSIGAEMFRQTIDADVKEILHRADRLMYERKRAKAHHASPEA